MIYSSFNRCGNAIVLSLGIIAVAAALLVTSSTSAVNNSQSASQRVAQIDTLASVEAVLARRESLVLTKASDGTLFSWTGIDGQEPNFGIDYFGDCEVKWKIEPARTIKGSDVGDATDSISWMANPPPDVGFEAVAPQQSNDFIYLFRISAEATKPGTGNYALTRSQGVRYVSVNQEPLFRYVIFYAPKGPKGDLELSHADDVVIQGSVHTNGALYLGSKTLVNSWATTTGPGGKTQIGPVAFKDLNENGVWNSGEPQNLPVRVNGVDGIFRLSKPLMYTALNSYPVVGVAPGGWATTTAYDTDSSLAYPRDAVTGVTASELTDIANAVVDGIDLINPYRVKDASGFVTLGSGYAGTPKSAARTINDRSGNRIPILGLDDPIDSTPANDARDGSLAATPGRWRTNSMNEFGGQARTNETGGRIKKLPTDLIGTDSLPLRPLEAQSVQYVDVDGDTTSDDHEYAQPLFRSDAGTTTNPQESLTDLGRIVEAPGKYLSLALGEGRNLARKTSGTGWDVVDDSGNVVTSNPSAVGLVIRERAVPDTALWPGDNTATAISESADAYMPYAYGKHFRPSTWPFAISDVTDGLYNNAQGDTWGRFGIDPANTTKTVDQINRGGPLREHAYQEGGTIRVVAAVAEGQGDFWDGVDGNSGEDYTRRPRFYADNWRFVHLRKPTFAQEAAPVPGVTVRYFKDTNPEDEGTYQNGGYLSFYSPSGANTGFNLCGTPTAGPYVRNFIDSTAAVADRPWPNPAPAGVANPTERFSTRIEGYLVPRYSEVYTLRVSNMDDGVRVWLDGRLLNDLGSDPDREVWNWKSQGGQSMDLTTQVKLSAGVGYHLVVEHNDGNGGEGVTLSWSSDTQAQEVIPAGTTTGPQFGLYQKTIGTGFPLNTWSALQARIPTANLTRQADKAALMIRSEDAGFSPVLSARDRYVSIAFNQVRGVFTQRRMEPAKPLPTDLGSYDYFIGKGSATQTSPTASTITSASGVMGIPATRQNETATFNGQNYAYSAYTREAKLTPATPTYTTRTDEVQTGYDTAKVDVQSVSYTVNMGDGVTKTVWAGTNNGLSQTASKAYTPKSRQRGRRYKYVSLTLSGHEMGFDAANDDGKQIRFFNASSSNPAATETTNGVYANWAANYNVPDSTHVVMRYAEYTDWTSYAYGAQLPPSQRVVAPNLVFGNPGADVVAMMNALNTGGRSDWVASSISANSSSGLISASNPSAPSSYPSAPAYGAFNANTIFDDGLPRSFALNRGSQSRGCVHDINSYISAYGTWFSPTVDQYLPWNNAWNTNYALWTTAKTGSFRPDLWAGGTPGLAPVLGDTASSVYSATGRWADDQPGTITPTTFGEYVWLRIEKIPATNNVKFRYAVSDPTTTPSNWNDVVDQVGNPVTANLTGWNSLLMGPAVQSGSTSVATTAEFEQVRIEFSAVPSGDVDGNMVLNSADWDSSAGGGGFSTSRYLASQYQVFWGAYDITEDFFTYCEADPLAKTATEDWIYSPREFWSQASNWDNGDAKDPAGNDTILNRMLWSKTTLFSLNMGANDGADHNPDETGTQLAGVQGYLRSRLLSDAVKKPISTGTAPVVAADGLLYTMFNGLVYTARTNRYPFNPNRDTGLIGGKNPYSFDLTRPYPNTYTGTPADDYVEMLPNTAGWNDFTLSGDTTTTHLLQPYTTLSLAPPIKPQEFHHGVRIWNAAKIWYGYSAAGSFGESKLSIVTPNQLYIHGDLNKTTNNVTTPSSPTANKAKHTPLACFGDVIHLLSNAFTVNRWQNPGINVASDLSYSGAGVLGSPTVFSASNTEYWSCFLTHNTPTTRHSVREGQGAAFVDTMMFMENWSGKTMRYVGSLVMLDSRRYTRAFLMDANKTFGRTVFGNTLYSGLAAGDKTAWIGIHGAADWTGQTPLAYNPPVRLYEFNDDLLIQEGTPPFTPFGLTVSGLGGWSRIIQ